MGPTTATIFTKWSAPAGLYSQGTWVCITDDFYHFWLLLYKLTRMVELLFVFNKTFPMVIIWWSKSSKFTTFYNDVFFVCVHVWMQCVSPCVKYSVLNVLYSYVYTVRLFNGGHSDLPLQAAQVRTWGRGGRGGRGTGRDGTKKYNFHFFPLRYCPLVLLLSYIASLILHCQ